MTARDSLQESLNALAAEAALLDAGSCQEVAGHSAKFLAWLENVVAQRPDFNPILAQTGHVLEGLRQGLDCEPGYERLNQLLNSALALLAGAAQEPAKAADKEPALHTMDALERESWGDFIIECPELLGQVEDQLLSGLRGSAFDALKVLRPLHTLKGICGMLGLEAQSVLMHACEDALQPYRNATSLPQDVAKATLEALDRLRAQTAQVEAGLNKGSFALLDTDAALETLKSLKHEAQAAEAGAGKEEPQAGPESSVRGTDNVIRIPVSKMDLLLEAVGELAICQAQVTAGIRELGTQGLLSTEAGRLEKISRQLQQVVLGLRMVPVQPLFNRISRQAYDLSLRMGKPLQVDIRGGETEVDKGLIEELFEPLLHLVRNALDHGMDTPEERLANGKPEQGRLRLAAFHQGGDFVLQMEDDGRGFNLEAIAAKLRAEGRLKPGEEPSGDWLIEQLFQAGFSTAATLTDLSGRGVGLDAVRRKISDLKGQVSASHQPGQGATFTLRLPLTLALMDAILVRAKGERYALPAAQVLRFIAWSNEARHSLGEGEAWMEADGRSLALVDLGAGKDGRPVAMHVAVGGKEACLVVDEVLGKQQVVVKALGGLLQDLPGLGGGAVLADGRVGLILDLESLLKERAIV